MQEKKHYAHTANRTMPAGSRKQAAKKIPPEPVPQEAPDIPVPEEALDMPVPEEAPDMPVPEEPRNRSALEISLTSIFKKMLERKKLKIFEEIFEEPNCFERTLEDAAASQKTEVLIMKLAMYQGLRNVFASPNPLKNDGTIIRKNPKGRQITSAKESLLLLDRIFAKDVTEAIIYALFAVNGWNEKYVSDALKAKAAILAVESEETIIAEQSQHPEETPEDVPESAPEDMREAAKPTEETPPTLPAINALSFVSEYHTDHCETMEWGENDIIRSGDVENHWGVKIHHTPAAEDTKVTVWMHWTNLHTGSSCQASKEYHLCAGQTEIVWADFMSSLVCSPGVHQFRVWLENTHQISGEYTCRFTAENGKFEKIGTMRAVEQHCITCNGRMQFAYFHMTVSRRLRDVHTTVYLRLFDPDNNMVANRITPVTIEGGKTSCAVHFGYSNPDCWKHGRYSYEISLNGSVPVCGSFEVT